MMVQSDSWVAVYVRANWRIWYFDFFGVRPPQKTVDLGLSFVHIPEFAIPEFAVRAVWDYSLYFIRACDGSRDV